MAPSSQAVEEELSRFRPAARNVVLMESASPRVDLLPRRMLSDVLDIDSERRDTYPAGRATLHPSRFITTPSREAAQDGIVVIEPRVVRITLFLAPHHPYRVAWLRRIMGRPLCT